MPRHESSEAASFRAADEAAELEVVRVLRLYADDQRSNLECATILCATHNQLVTAHGAQGAKTLLIQLATAAGTLAQLYAAAAGVSPEALLDTLTLSMRPE
ncbi:hypothetical protein [Streptomyces sp. HUAS TT20]|uniref:hypothetical protein n=1 Tax=Streptomyces sp. HUAS TT20 TaxID=3447509 RepID=UPI0021D980AE|nr:hypothetical protein [Streptomyces sp. HUAS 15-9]UXY28565.1 hypothetical protein N8I87_19705 [Streptomyces sp. HUAS 15-9]